MLTRYTRHCLLKLELQESKKHSITKTLIDNALRRPLYTDLTHQGEVRSFGPLIKDLELCVVSRDEGGIIVVITFYPCKKGRYGKKESRSKN